MIAAIKSPEIPLLSAEKITFERDDRSLFEPVNFSIDSGQALIVRGANGVGKTTLLRCLAGLLTPSSGQVHCPQETAISYLGHRLGIHDELTPVENLDFALHLLPARSPGTDHSLLAAGLGHRLQMPAGRLSAGQRKRLALARLAQSSAQLWLLDEPFSNLDQQGVCWVCGMIQAHLDQGGGAIIAHHGTLPAAFPHHAVLEMTPC